MSTLSGTVLAIDEGTLTLQSEGSPIVVPRATIAKVDVRRRKAQRAKGGLIGAALGGGIGYLMGSNGSSKGRGGQSYNCQWCVGNELDLNLGGAGATFGALVGFGLGALAAGEKWEKDVSVDGLQLSLGPTRTGGVALSFSLGF